MLRTSSVRLPRPPEAVHPLSSSILARRFHAPITFAGSGVTIRSEYNGSADPMLLQEHPSSSEGERRVLSKIADASMNYPFSPLRTRTTSGGRRSLVPPLGCRSDCTSTIERGRFHTLLLVIFPCVSFPPGQNVSRSFSLPSGQIARRLRSCAASLCLQEGQHFVQEDL